jgi:formylglycine-generating enzyme required for sulfatase activity
MAGPRILVSHAAPDDAFAQALVAGVRAAGVDAWCDEQQLDWGALRAALDRELPTRPVFVVILSPEALAAAGVQLAIAIADELTRTREVRERVAVMVRACAVPPELANFRLIDATQDAMDASVALLDQLGLSGSVAAGAALVAVRQTPAARPLTQNAAVLPPRFNELGYKGWRVGDAELILPPLCLVPDGPCVMGSQADPSEAPPHTISLPVFAIGTHPVLVAEYACFVRAGHALPANVGRITWEAQFSRLDHPIVNVSWRDATAYAAWLSQLTGQTWRLPTEAEWEKAARWDDARGHAREYPWGDHFESVRCNTRESTLGATTAAGTYPNGASPCGAQDMAGNVREWTSTLYAPYPYDAEDGRERADSHGERVQRGSSWFSFASDARAAFREWHAPEDVSAVVGFRLVLEAPPGV